MPMKPTDRKQVHDDDDELILWNGWPTKGVEPYFHPGPMSEFSLSQTSNLPQDMIWTCAEAEFKLCWMKLYSNVNHCITGPQWNRIS